MTIQPYQQPEPPAAPPVADPTGGRLIAWADGLAAAHKIGAALCQTAFAPAHFRGKPEDAAAAILYGDEIGLTPTQALRSIYVVSGTPGMYARQMVALVLARGHDVWTVEKSDARVTVAGRRRGSSHVHEETWTTARAQKAGYLTNKKYQTDPQAMLYARAAADVCRQVAPDALAGLAYAIEELELVDAPTTTTRRAPAAPTTVRRAQPPAAPDPEPDLTPEPPRTGPADPITPAQLTALHASLTDAGITKRDDALAFYAEVTGRDVATSKDLTKAEASQVIDELHRRVTGESEPVDEPEPGQ